MSLIDEVFGGMQAFIREYVDCTLVEIPSFTRLPPRYTTDVFECAGFLWQLLVCPQGNHQDDCLSVFLIFPESAPDCAPRRVRFQIAVIDHSSYSFSLHRDTKLVELHKKADWGFSTFAPNREIRSPHRGFLLADTLSLCLFVSANVGTIQNPSSAVPTSMSVDTSPPSRSSDSPWRTPSAATDGSWAMDAPIVLRDDENVRDSGMCGFYPDDHGNAFASLMSVYFHIPAVSQCIHNAAAVAATSSPLHLVRKYLHSMKASADPLLSPNYPVAPSSDVDGGLLRCLHRKLAEACLSEIAQSWDVSIKSGEDLEPALQRHCRETDPNTPLPPVVFVFPTSATPSEDGNLVTSLHYDIGAYCGQNSQEYRVFAVVRSHTALRTMAILQPVDPSGERRAWFRFDRELVFAVPESQVTQGQRAFQMETAFAPPFPMQRNSVHSGFRLPTLMVVLVRVSDTKAMLVPPAGENIVKAFEKLRELRSEAAKFECTFNPCAPSVVSDLRQDAFAARESARSLRDQAMHRQTVYEGRLVDLNQRQEQLQAENADCDRLRALLAEKQAAVAGLLAECDEMKAKVAAALAERAESVASSQEAYFTWRHLSAAADEASRILSDVKTKEKKWKESICEARKFSDEQVELLLSYVRMEQWAGPLAKAGLTAAMLADAKPSDLTEVCDDAGQRMSFGDAFRFITLIQSIVNNGIFPDFSEEKQQRPRESELFLWSCDNVVEYVEEKGLPSVAALLRQHRVNGMVLMNMNDESDLHTVGITTPALRVQFRKILNDLRPGSKVPPNNSPHSQAASHFICPITHDVMSDPVICTDGLTYERAAIEEWLRNHNKSPMTGTVLANKTLIPNIVLRSVIQEYVTASRNQK